MRPAPPAPRHIPPRQTMRNAMRAVKFLYEDNSILIVDKPAGLPVISPGISRAPSLYDSVTQHIQKKNPKGRAGLVHRLDRDASGVMVFAKNAAAKSMLMRQWNTVVTLRRYVALVEASTMFQEGVFDSWLKENAGGTVYETPPHTHGALRSITHWRSCAAGNGYTLLELELATGRKHQIRAQLAAAGAAIAGDARYGAVTNPAGRLCLHATVLELRGYGRFESPAPPMFEKILTAGRTRNKA